MSFFSAVADTRPDWNHHYYYKTTRIASDDVVDAMEGFDFDYGVVGVFVLHSYCCGYCCRCRCRVRLPRDGGCDNATTHRNENLRPAEDVDLDAPDRGNDGDDAVADDKEAAIHDDHSRLDGDYSRRVVRRREVGVRRDDWYAQIHLVYLLSPLRD